MKKTLPNSLNKAEQIFCDYLINNNFRDYTNAYIASHPKCTNKDSASVSGYRLYRREHVQNYLAEQRKAMFEKVAISKGEIINNLVKIMEDNLDHRPTVAIKAIENINKMLGFNEKQKIDITTSDRIKINIEMTPDTEPEKDTENQ